MGDFNNMIPSLTAKFTIRAFPGLLKDLHLKKEEKHLCAIILFYNTKKIYYIQKTRPDLHSSLAISLF